jgi:hypothetical protein
MAGACGEIATRAFSPPKSGLKDPDVVPPDQVVDERSTIEPGGTQLDLIYVGRNHSDNSLVMLLPKCEGWGGCNVFPFGSVEWFCEYWGRGY